MAYTLPEIGLETSTSARALAVRDRRSGNMVPLARLLAGDKVEMAETVDAGSMTVSDPQATRPRSATDRVRDREVCIFDFLPSSVVDAIRAGTNTTDVTEALKAAIATGRDVFLPGPTLSGTQALYPLSDRVPYARNGQKVRGAGRLDSLFLIKAAPPPAAAPAFDSYLSLTGYCEVEDIGFRFDQSAAMAITLPAKTDAGYAAAVLAAYNKLVRYPPAIDISAAERPRIKRVQISAAWDGIKGDGNCGGVVLEDIEYGAFNQGCYLDKLRDFPHTRNLHFFPFGIADFFGGGADSTLHQIYQAFPPSSLFLGSCDGLKIDLNTFQGRVQFSETAAGAPFGTVPGLNLDGNAARIEAQGRCSLTIGALYKTTALTTDFCILAGGGAKVHVGAIDIQVPDNGINIPPVTGPFIRSTGTDTLVTIGSGKTYAASPDCVMGQADSGGTLVVGPVRSLGYTDKARTGGVWKEANGGTLIVQGASSCPRGSGSGAFIEVGTDRAEHAISGCNSGGFTIFLPAGASLGCYGPNKCPKTPFVPTLTFATPGNYAATYSSRQGFYWYTASGIEFELRIVGTSNAYTGASGAARIGGLPVKSSLDNRPVLLGEWGGAALPSGRSTLNAVLSAGDGGIYFPANGSGVQPAYLTAGELPPSQGFTFGVTGFVPTL